MNEDYESKYEDNEPIIFRSYLRRLIRDLKDIDEATPQTNENSKAKELLKRLIEDTQRDIEDN